MEGSMRNSSMNRGVAADSDERTLADQESSGWTAYFEDFSNHRKEDSFCSGFGSSSMVSDAASYPAWKSSSPNHTHNHNQNHNPVLASSSLNVPNKLTFKKEKARKFSHHDESLEDTASSPVNSPKVSDFLPTDMNPRKTNDHFNSSLGKECVSEHYGVVETDDERCEMSCSSGNKDCTDLKKRGLCLVPLSMLVNYLG